MTFRTLCLCAAAVLVPIMAAAQEASGDQPEEESKHVMWLIPNFATSPTLTNYEPLTTAEKFKEASEDSFDQGTVALALIFAGQGQLGNSNRSFGQGAAGFGRYFGAAYGDLLIGNFMTEGVFPTLLHQDPRYFRRGTGTGWSRIRYAMGQIFWTHNDSGKMQFNYSEIGGNAVASAIGTAYYANNRTVGDVASNAGIQIGIDMATNVLKEFWPDLKKKLHRRNRIEAEQAYK